MRHAASVWVEAQRWPSFVRKLMYQNAATRIAYYQRRNWQARASHTKTTRRRLSALGIRVDCLRSCVPDSS